MRLVTKSDSVFFRGHHHNDTKVRVMIDLFNYVPGFLVAMEFLIKMCQTRVGDLFLSVPSGVCI
jgi:hypothetical protein